MRVISVRLFSEGDLGATLGGRLDGITQSVQAIPREQFLATSVDTLVDHLSEPLTIEPLALHEDQMQMDQAETKVDVTGRFDYNLGMGGGRIHTTGHSLTFFIPFIGDADLWRLRPNLWMTGLPPAQIDASKSLLILEFSNTSDTDPEQYKRDLQSALNGIRQVIASQGHLLGHYNNEIRGRARSVVDQRRAELQRLEGLASSFNIPMVKKPGMPEFTPIEVVKRIPRPLPRPPAAGYKPEPAISNETYDQLLAIIRHAGASFEGTPQTYAPLGEEGLRDNVLSHINVVFEGKATGETFRKYGKTDIRLEEASRSAFVGECKLWGGGKVLLGALEQLLDYVTWRDCKAALLIFNKDVAAFSQVQEVIGTALQAHPKFLRSTDTNHVGEWRFVFKSNEDEGREVTVHVFAFNLYVTPERAAKRR